MDFSDFSEFLGPLVFALIAWLSNYFNKKKKPVENLPSATEKKDGIKKDSSLENIFQSAFTEINNKLTKDEPINILENKDVSKDKIIIDDKLSEDESMDKSNSIEKESFKPSPKRNKLISRRKTLSSKLKNNKSLKEAIVLKEILDRKY